jgi:pimeloyl-ACP methyl ester carboxylesterase
MSGSYSLPFLVERAQSLSGFVAIAPVAIIQYAHQLQNIDLPTLLIWGSNDNIVPLPQADLLATALTNSRKITLENAGHACYMKATPQFHQHLLEFCALTFTQLRNS